MALEVMVGNHVFLLFIHAQIKIQHIPVRFAD